MFAVHGEKIKSDYFSNNQRVLKMDEQSPRQTRVVRKSAFGRTGLFLPSTNVILREVRCMGGVTRHDGVSVFHMHNMENKENVVCWHCCEEFEGDGMPIPRIFDPIENVYHVYGHFCSPSCCKGYILEHTTFDRGQHMNVFVKMLRQVYGIHHAVVEAPPRISLKKFGGMFDIAEFRKMHNICTVCQPPFVSYCMVVEECMQQPQMELINESMIVDEAKDGDVSQPVSEGLYKKFLNNKREDLLTVRASTMNRKRKEPTSSSSHDNTLIKYAEKVDAVQNK
jgi:hypothetical protein